MVYKYVAARTRHLRAKVTSRAILEVTTSYVTKPY